MGATVDEWVGASEYVRRRGNDNVILCERGIRTFESRTRNTLDVSSIVVVRELTDLDYTTRDSADGVRTYVNPDGGAILAVIDRGNPQEARLSALDDAGEAVWTLRLSCTTPPAAQVLALYLVLNADGGDEKAVLRDIADAMQVQP